jgi:hypothetical protein
VTLHSGVRYQAKIEEKQPKMPQNRLKIVSQPSKSLEHHFEPPQNNFLSSKTHRRPQAGREILARHVNILPTLRRKSPNSQHQHFGRAVSTVWESLRVERVPLALPVYSLQVCAKRNCTSQWGVRDEINMKLGHRKC